MAVRGARGRAGTAAEPARVAPAACPAARVPAALVAADELAERVRGMENVERALVELVEDHDDDLQRCGLPGLRGEEEVLGRAGHREVYVGGRVTRRMG